MVVSEDGVQASGATFHVQAAHATLSARVRCSIARAASLLRGRISFRRGVLCPSMPVLGVFLLGTFLLGSLSACSNSGSFSPIDWWHRQEGGKIADERPAPPGADQPYPNLNTVPGRPTPPNPDDLNKLTAALVADRTNAQHEAQATPMADPSSPSASPGLFGVGSAPPPGAAPPASPANSFGAGNQGAGATPPTGAPAAPPMASASMPAVTTPPPPPAPPAPAPRKAVQSAPLEPPPPAEPPPAPPPVAQVAHAPAAAQSAAAPFATTPSAPVAATSLAPPATPTAAAAQADANAPPPALPTEPPPRPAIAGSAPAPVVTPPPMPVGKAAQNATIVFPDGSTTLSQPATAEVKSFAAKRGNGVIMVTGFGEAASADPVAQSAAVNMGLARAIAIAAALKAAGVPGPAIRVSAEAAGRGASLVLLQ
jgi:hypothetical protein